MIYKSKIFGFGQEIEFKKHWCERCNKYTLAWIYDIDDLHPEERIYCLNCLKETSREEKFIKYFH